MSILAPIGLLYSININAENVLCMKTNYYDKFFNFVNCAESPRHIPNQKGTRQLNYYTQKNTHKKNKHKQLKQIKNKKNKYLTIQLVHLEKRRSTTPLQGLCFCQECIFVQLAVSNNSVNTKTAKLCKMYPSTCFILIYYATEC